MYSVCIHNLQDKISRLRREINELDDEISLFISLEQESSNEIDIEKLKKELSNKEDLLQLAEKRENELFSISREIDSIDEKIDTASLYKRNSARIEQLLEKQNKLDFRFTQMYNEIIDRLD